jgi:hypothetical protein
MFDVTVVEDLSGSMTEFVPKENEFPCLLADTRTIRAALRILEKQELVRPISRPKVMAKADERATVQVGQEIPDQEKSFAGLKVNVLGRELGGGMAVEFELRQNDANANLGVSMSLVVPDGHSIVVRADKFPPNQQAQADASDDAPESGPKYPVYVVLTPTRVR